MLLAINKIYMLPFIAMIVILLMSPAIQLSLSTKKNKYLGYIFPTIVFIFFLLVTIFFKPPVILAVAMTIGAPAALIAFHIIIRNNMRF